MSLGELRKIIKLSFLCVSCLAFVLALQAQTSTKDQRIAEVESHLTSYSSIKNAPIQQWTLESRMAELHVPAVSIAAIKDGRIDWARAYGVRFLGGPPVTPNELFAAASISKPVTAMGMLKLVEEGKINLDVDVNQYLRRWKIPETIHSAEEGHGTRVAVLYFGHRDT